MGKTNPRNSGGPGTDGQTIFLAVILVAALSVLGTVQIGAVASWKLAGKDKPPLNPFQTLAGLIKGQIEWTVIATVAAVLLWLAIAGLVYLWMKSKPKKTTSTTGQASKYLAPKSDIASLSRKSAEKKAAKFIGEDAAKDYPGLRMGKDLQSRRGVYSSWEDLYLVIFGPRRGKTTSQVIPAIVDAPGNVLTTSNKADIVYDTAAITEVRGNIWIFDPQGLVAGRDDRPWYFDPLDAVRRDPMKMDSEAIALADIFRSAAHGDNSTGDAFFSEGGRDLLGRLFLAAALDNRPITDVFRWVNDDEDRTPVGILQRFDEWESMADALNGTYSITERTRSGLFSQAAQMAAPLGRRAIRQWVTPGEDKDKFEPEQFVRADHDTLYLLSKEGVDNAAALTTALAAATMKAAERYGEENGLRLPVPMIAALDEAANTVPWPELPKLYSHYGSRGIIVMTILQSYAQGVKAWGKEGMEALWSAASVLLYGGGVRDQDMLNKLELLIGDYEELTKSVSRSADGGRSTSIQAREKKILNAAELAALPYGQALAFTGRRPFALYLEPFWERTYWNDDTRQLLPAQQ
ncbi:TraM recognition domain-containing protein [Corynebacterium sp. ACRQM]|uniref:type IV secretory system conjugative DNA transfer family protein n=1 Tax=unclassified Corynebacterium TaxID=2624378 RepID=UPI001EF62AFA|nr:type IV secretory system conjugative DNA transfer family protein [Corynebacterium sp. ACRPR]MCG7234435.1 TraM recognition domain-containing protein [Corynebacterium sp. ACRPR]MCG7272390.1 TraM recognition domain-containing protein [Corynebacterium sp. ACRQM]